MGYTAFFGRSRSNHGAGIICLKSMIASVFLFTKLSPTYSQLIHKI
jgi:hypothetical protein